MTEALLELPEHSKEFSGYHGTSKESADAIVKSNFDLSKNPDDWLGHGVYFFVEGISCPISNAKEWALNRAWSKETRSFSYSQYVVLTVQISGTNVLNTNNTEDLIAFNEVSAVLIEKEKIFKNRRRDSKEDNRIIWNLVADFMELEIIIHNLYIKSKSQRINKIVSNVPNTTVMCIKNKNNIHFDTLKIVDQGDIK